MTRCRAPEVRNVIEDAVDNLLDRVHAELAREENPLD